MRVRRFARFECSLFDDDPDDAVATILEFKKWSWVRASEMLRNLSSEIEDVISEIRSSNDTGEATEVEMIASFVSAIASRPTIALSLIRESLSNSRSIDPEVITELPPEDVVGAIEAIVDLNLTEDLLKKTRRLVERLQSTRAPAEPSSPSNESPEASS